MQPYTYARSSGSQRVQRGEAPLLGVDKTIYERSFTGIDRAALMPHNPRTGRSSVLIICSQRTWLGFKALHILFKSRKAAQAVKY